MLRQLVLSIKTNNTSVKAKEFLLLLSSFVVVRYNALLYIRQFCR